MIRFVSLEILSAGPTDGARRRPFHLVYGGQRYDAALQWSEALDADLAAFSQLRSDEGADARLAAALRSLVLPVWPRIEAELEGARAAGDPVRVDLVLNDLELSGLPWELLEVHSFNLGLAHIPQLQLRYSLSNRPRVGLRPADCPVLMGWAGRVPEPEHREALEAAWGERFDPGQHDVEMDLPRLDEMIRAKNPAILHLLCHTVEVAPGEFALALRARAGGDERVTPAMMARVLGQHADRLQVVVLCACAGGDIPSIDAVSSVARELHGVGVQAVIASRLPLSAQGSVNLARTLFESLARGAALEDAVLEARAALRVRDGRSRDAEAIQLYAAPGQDTRLLMATRAPARVETAPVPPPVDPGPPQTSRWPKLLAAGLGLAALVGGIAYFWPSGPDAPPEPVVDSKGGGVVPPIHPPHPRLDSSALVHPKMKLRVQSLERSLDVDAGQAPADACGGASSFGSAVMLSRDSYVLVGDPSALGGRGHVYAYDQNAIDRGRELARYRVPAGGPLVSTLGDPAAGAVDGAKLGASIAEFGNAELYIAPALSPNGVPPLFDPTEPVHPPSWLGPTLETTLRGQSVQRAVGWLPRDYGALALSTGDRVYALLFGAEGLVGRATSFNLEHAFLAGVFQDPERDDSRSGVGVLASGYGGDCGAGRACTVLYSYGSAQTAWRVGGGPVAVGEFDGEPGLDGAVFDVETSAVWILSDIGGQLDAETPRVLDPAPLGFRVSGLPEGALAQHPESLALISLGTLDGDAVEDLALGVPYVHFDGKYREGGVYVWRSEAQEVLAGLGIDSARVFDAPPAYRAVSLSYDPDMGTHGTLAMGATGLFASDGATSCGGVVLIEDPMRWVQ